MTTATTPAAWLGWYKPRRGTWQVVVSGDSEAEAFARLLRHDAPDPHGELLTLPAGRRPEDKKPKRKGVARHDHDGSP
jgi:hypothetical protein